MEFVRGSEQEVLTHWMGLLAVLALVLLVGGIVTVSRLPKTIKALVWVGLAFRLTGAFARFWVLQSYYGAGDATGYFGKGWQFAQEFRRFNFAPVTEGKQWYGTEFVRSVSGGVLAIIGPSMFAEFIVFSMFAFIGLIGFAIAFRRAYPDASMNWFLLWIWVFPSLWFWPSSIGKEALVLMGIGLAVMGFMGRRERIGPLAFVLGLFFMFAVRPQVVAVFLAAVVLAQFLSFNGRWTTQKLIQGSLLLIVGLVGISYAMRSVGMEQFDVEGVQEYVEGDKARETAGRTSVEAVSPGLKGIPMAMINVLVRPLPWEATNAMVLVSALEMLCFWSIVFLRRRNLVRSLRHWRSDRLLRLAVAFAFIYSVGLGMMLVNIGIIARQRIFLFPFLFLLLEAQPRAAYEESLRSVRKRAKALAPYRRRLSPAVNVVEGVEPKGSAS